ncbi:hypothetical protein, partial [Pseudomonas sp. GM78]|uniref:hypothetical protein n=1 Tax=Pseudomonas sp. GM78 TaxID=1144337 RepID=UPI001EE643B5
QSLLLTFWRLFEKGTRRKGETISGRYRSNGYVHTITAQTKMPGKKPGIPDKLQRSKSQSV